MSLILLASAICAALAYGLWFCHRPPNGPKTAIKTISVAALALWGLALGGPWLLVLALALSSAGDFFLSRDGERAFLAGLVSFALGHLAYIVLFSGLAVAYPPLIAMLLILGFAASTEIWLAPFTGDLRWPVRAYVVLIVGMAVLALSLPNDLWRVQIGALAFLASDTLLSIQLFRLPSGAGAHRVISPALWALYWGAQALIAWGIMGQGF